MILSPFRRGKVSRRVFWSFRRCKQVGKRSVVGDVKLFRLFDDTLSATFGRIPPDRRTLCPTAFGLQTKHLIDTIGDICACSLKKTILILSKHNRTCLSILSLLKIGAYCPSISRKHLTILLLLASLLEGV